MTDETRTTKHEQRIVCIGGGAGMPRVLTALRSHDVHLTAIVTMADNGGSAGLLRKEYGTLPNGDVRRALAALASVESPLKDLMTYRFKGGTFDNYSAGSIFLTTLESVTGSFEKSIDVASELLQIQGEVLPVTLDDVQLRARLADGTEIFGETDIDVPKHASSAKIEKIWLEPALPSGGPEAQANPRALVAIARADMIIIGPGDLYTSLTPNLLVAGVPEAIKNSKAKKVFIANLMTKYGETQGFTAEDFVKAIEAYVPLDVVIFNNKKPSEELLQKYRQEKAEFISPPEVEPLRDPKVRPHWVFADVLSEDGLIRHDNGSKLAKVILNL